MATLIKLDQEHSSNRKKHLLRRCWFATALAVAWLASSGGSAHAQGPGVSREYPLKAAFLYNFGNYVEWPADAFASKEAPFVIGIMGQNPFGAILNEIAATKQLQGRSIVIRHVATAADAATCQILFIGASVAEPQRTAMVDATAALPVLVVCETPGAAADGAAVNFFVEQNKVRFEINTRAVQERRLKVSSKLMSLAKVVEPRSAAGN